MANTFNAITTGTGGIATTGDSSGAFSFSKDGGTASVNIDATGNVGIGTASPGYPLDVQSESSNGRGIRVRGRSSDGIATIQFTDSTVATEYAKINTPAASTLAFSTAGTERMRIASDGTITSTLGGMQVRSGTAVASTSGTSIDFTSIPSWVKRITVMFNGVSTNGSSPVQIQLGTSSGATTSGYLGSSASLSTSVTASTSTAGFKLNGGTAGAGEIINGLVTISLLNSSTNTWAAFGGVGRSDAGQIYYCAGSVPLSAALDRVRITTVNGTDTFDAGTINILYE